MFPKWRYVRTRIGSRQFWNGRSGRCRNAGAPQSSRADLLRFLRSRPDGAMCLAASDAVCRNYSQGPQGRAAECARPGRSTECTADSTVSLDAAPRSMWCSPIPCLHHTSSRVALGPKRKRAPPDDFPSSNFSLIYCTRVNPPRPASSLDALHIAP